jgi:hypothetical protein
VGKGQQVRHHPRRNEPDEDITHRGERCDLRPQGAADVGIDAVPIIQRPAETDRKAAETSTCHHLAEGGGGREGDLVSAVDQRLSNREQWLEGAVTGEGGENRTRMAPSAAGVAGSAAVRATPARGGVKRLGRPTRDLAAAQRHVTSRLRIRLDTKQSRFLRQDCPEQVFEANYQVVETVLNQSIWTPPALVLRTTQADQNPSPSAKKSEST